MRQKILFMAGLIILIGVDAGAAGQSAVQSLTIYSGRSEELVGPINRTV